jgi:hypothetical protein
MADDARFGASLTVLKGAIVALLIAAAAVAPPSARADPPTAATIERVSDAGAFVAPSTAPPQDASDARVAEPSQDPVGAARPSGAPKRTLPPTDTELPAVDGSH